MFDARSCAQKAFLCQSPLCFQALVYQYNHDKAHCGRYLSASASRAEGHVGQECLSQDSRGAGGQSTTRKGWYYLEITVYERVRLGLASLIILVLMNLYDHLRTIINFPKTKSVLQTQDNDRLVLLRFGDEGMQLRTTISSISSHTQSPLIG